MISMEFLLTLSSLNQASRSWEWRKWSRTQEAIVSLTNSPCQHLRKFIYYSMENMHGVPSIKLSEAAALQSPFFVFLISSRWFCNLCLVWSAFPRGPGSVMFMLPMLIRGHTCRSDPKRQSEYDALDICRHSRNVSLRSTGRNGE